MTRMMNAWPFGWQEFSKCQLWIGKAKRKDLSQDILLQNTGLSLLIGLSIFVYFHAGSLTGTLQCFIVYLSSLAAVQQLFDYAHRKGAGWASWTCVQIHIHHWLAVWPWIVLSFKTRLCGTKSGKVIANMECDEGWVRQCLCGGRYWSRVSTW